MEAFAPADVDSANRPMYFAVARERFETALQHYLAIGNRLGAVEYIERLAQVEAALGEAVFDHAPAEGRVLAPENAVAAALGATSDGAAMAARAPREGEPPS